LGPANRAVTPRSSTQQLKRPTRWPETGSCRSAYQPRGPQWRAGFAHAGDATRTNPPGLSACEVAQCSGNHASFGPCECSSNTCSHWPSGSRALHVFELRKRYPFGSHSRRDGQAGNSCDKYSRKRQLVRLELFVTVEACSGTCQIMHSATSTRSAPELEQEMFPRAY
jgi:hypothetical protein